MKLTKLYLAGPLFSLTEKQFNIELKELLQPYFTVYLPQEDGKLLINMAENGVDPKEASKMIFDEDIKAISECDVFLIILDGRVIDEGASFELGFAYSLKKKCIGLQTDDRRLLQIGDGNNPMISNSLDLIFDSLSDLLEWSKKETKSLIS